MNAKPLAALTSGLLARKGAAKPAMRPQGFGSFGHRQEDLGWNDMGFDAPQPVAEPHPFVEPPAVVRQQEEIATRLTAPVSTPSAVSGMAKEKAAFTLRLDGDRGGVADDPPYDLRQERDFTNAIRDLGLRTTGYMTVSCGPAGSRRRGAARDGCNRSPSEFVRIRSSRATG